MQGKRHMTKWIKLSSKFPSWKTLKGSEIRLHYLQKQKFREISLQTDVGNKEMDLRKKNLSSWLNILNSRQIVADIGDKLVDQGEVLHGGIGSIYFSLSNKWKQCHGVRNSWPRNLRTALKKYFRFQGNCKQTTGWTERQYSKLWDLFPNFLWNYTYNFENIFTARS